MTIIGKEDKTVRRLSIHTKDYDAEVEVERVESKNGDSLRAEFSGRLLYCSVDLPFEDKIVMLSACVDKFVKGGVQ